MNTETPETDAAYIQRPNEGSWDFKVRQEKVMEKLERERDEAREQRDDLAESILNLSHPNCEMLIRERDEWREKADYSRIVYKLWEDEGNRLERANNDIKKHVEKIMREIAAIYSENAE